jgi:acyl-CoA dehydrogenase
MKVAYLDGKVGHGGEHKLWGVTNFLQRPPELPDAWTSDRLLRESLEFHIGSELYAAAEPALAEIGARATAPETIELVRHAEREPPVHVPYGPWGERIDEIRVSDAYLELGRWGVEAGVASLPYEETAFGDLARVVWAAQHVMWNPSSALYSCPIAMTDAAARTLLVHGGPEELPVVERLTTRDYGRAWTSGQWMTETAGGSDVGRTGTVARLEDGVWRLYGTKWFTSSTTSEMALTLARPEGAPEGARGLGLFRIETRGPDGGWNSIVVRRLKDKLGTRALPTAELELNGSIAIPIGDPTDGGGVRRIATMLNITRIHNALGACGGLSRGLSWARAYAQVREVFGARLADQPAHQATLADIAVDYAAALALTFRCCELTGRVEHGTASDKAAAVLRGLTPVTKLATAKWAVAGTTEVMESIGGVGYVEDSGVPAMVRNAHVLPIWEGTTNVLSLDLLRAAVRSDALEALIDDARKAATEAVHDPIVGEAAGSVIAALDQLDARSKVVLKDQERGQAGARALALGIANTYAAARLCGQATWAAARGDGRTAAIVRRLVQRGLVPPEPPERLELGMDDELPTSAPTEVR